MGISAPRRRFNLAHRSARPLTRRLTSILLIVTFLGLGSGGFAYLHERQHAAEDAAEDAAHRSGGLPLEHHHHDESNCHTCAQLHLPMTSADPPLGLVGCDRLVATAVPAPSIDVGRQPPADGDCRDPPAAA